MYLDESLLMQISNQPTTTFLNSTFQLFGLETLIAFCINSLVVYTLIMKQLSTQDYRQDPTPGKQDWIRQVIRLVYYFDSRALKLFKQL